MDLIEEFDLENLHTDDGDDDDTRYALAQVEWLEPITVDSADYEPLNTLMKELSAGDMIDSDKCTGFIESLKAAIQSHPAYQSVLSAAIATAEFIHSYDGVVDFNITNLMRRPSTGELVWADPVHIG